MLEALVSLEDANADTGGRGFDFHPLPARQFRSVPSALSPGLPHFVPSVGVRLSDPDLTVAYTGDSGPDPALVVLGRDADLYVMEATDRHQQPSIRPAASEQRMHLTAAEAGQAAARAGARRCCSPTSGRATTARLSASCLLHSLRALETCSSLHEWLHAVARRPGREQRR